MPYNNVSELPDGVKRRLKSDKQKRQWMHVFNSAHEKYGDEPRAFRIANGTVKALDDFDVQVTIQHEEGHAPLITFPMFETDEPELDESTTELTPVVFGAQAKQAGPPKNWLSSLASKLQLGLSLDGSTIQPPVTGDSVLLFKDNTTSRYRVLMRGTNMFKDRHEEIITQEAHKEFVEYIDASKEYPEFWLWHIKGSRWGQADFVGFSDGFLTVSGLVDEGKEEVAEKIAEHSKSLGVSHGFYGFSLDNKGLIDYYRSFEFSPLPIEHAANTWTAVMLAKEAELPLPKEKRDMLSKLGIPETTIDTWDKENKAFSDILKGAGIEYKDDSPAPPTPESTPAAGATQVTQEVEPTIKDVLAAVQGLATRLDGVETKQKELDKKADDFVASALETAIVPGRDIGHVASKSNDNIASKEEIDKQDEWLRGEFVDLVIGGKPSA